MLELRDVIVFDAEGVEKIVVVDLIGGSGGLRFVALE
jgi:hypothetical protein